MVDPAFAESEGKDNKGVFPVAGEFSEELHSVGQFIQDGSPIMFETFLDVKKQNASLIVEPDEKEDYLIIWMEKISGRSTKPHIMQLWQHIAKTPLSYDRSG